MKTVIVTTALLASATFGADLTFVSDINCTGQALYGSKDFPNISCYGMTYLDHTKSVILANLLPGEKITFFSDTNCRNELYSSSINLCYTEPYSQVRSFQVQTNDTSANAATPTTDVVPCGIRLSNYKGLSQASLYEVDLDFSRFAIGIILGIVGQLVALSTIATGCATIDTTDVLSVYGCIAAPIVNSMRTPSLLLNCSLTRYFCSHLMGRSISNIERGSASWHTIQGRI
jgi:hypothetical protein